MSEKGLFHVEEIPGRWPVEKAKKWMTGFPWLVGANYLPRTAINQVEMFQADTFDPGTIEEEMGWAEDLGFTCMRIYLHDLLWEQDAAGFLDRFDQVLGICLEHGIRVLPVFFDDCHRPDPATGVQPLPVKGYHNSGWAQSPGEAVRQRFVTGTVPEEEVIRLKGYVQGVLSHFENDHRIVAWELYNEPGQEGGENGSAVLLQDVWRWARDVNPCQPLCSTAHGSIGALNVEIALRNSDVISFHSYEDTELLGIISSYTDLDRPQFCTEYMARPTSTFQGALPLLKEKKVAAIHWGLVAGKSGTIWPWSSRDGVDVFALREQEETTVQPGEALPEPEVWFHDLLREDGSPYDPEETAFIRGMTHST